MAGRGTGAHRHRLPDLTIILDMPVQASIDRVRAKFEHRTTGLFGEEVVVTKDRIEQRPIEYHQGVRDKFLAQAKAHPDRYRVVPGDRSIEAVQAEVWKAACSLPR